MEPLIYILHERGWVVLRLSDLLYLLGYMLSCKMHKPNFLSQNIIETLYLVLKRKSDQTVPMTTYLCCEKCDNKQTNNNHTV